MDIARVCGAARANVAVIEMCRYRVAALSRARLLPTKTAVRLLAVEVAVDHGFERRSRLEELH